MIETTGARFDIGHPAPDRGRVRPIALLFGLAGAATAWSLQLLVNSSVAGMVCLDASGARTANDANAGTHGLLIGVNVVALLTAGLALAVGWLNLRHTHHERGHEAGGVMDAGEGRTRFLSVWGVWTSILFLVAIAFNTINVLWTGLCP